MPALQSGPSATVSSTQLPSSATHADRSGPHVTTNVSPTPPWRGNHMRMDRSTLPAPIYTQSKTLSPRTSPTAISGARKTNPTTILMPLPHPNLLPAGIIQPTLKMLLYPRKRRIKKIRRTDGHARKMHTLCLMKGARERNPRRRRRTARLP